MRWEYGKNYINRLFDKELEFYLKSVGAVHIVGPKWCGKSRTAKRYAKTTIDLMKKSVRDQFIPIAKQSPDVLNDIIRKLEYKDLKKKYTDYKEKLINSKCIDLIEVWLVDYLCRKNI